MVVLRAKFKKKKKHRTRTVSILIQGWIESWGQFSITIRPTKRSNRSARAASTGKHAAAVAEDGAFTPRKSVCVCEIQLIVFVYVAATDHGTHTKKFFQVSGGRACRYDVGTRAAPVGFFARRTLDGRARFPAKPPQRNKLKIYVV